MSVSLLEHAPLEVDWRSISCCTLTILRGACFCRLFICTAFATATAAVAAVLLGGLTLSL
jgi:hypothetical protein